MNKYQTRMLAVVATVAVAAFAGVGCAAPSGEDELGSERSELTLTIQAGKASRRAGVAAWTHPAQSRPGVAVMVPRAQSGASMAPLTMSSPRLGGTDVLEVRVGERVLQVDASGKIMQDTLIAKDRELLALYKADAEDYLAHGEVAYGPCNTEYVRALIAAAAAGAACAATGPLGCGLAIAAAAGAYLTYQKCVDEHAKPAEQAEAELAQ